MYRIFACLLLQRGTAERSSDCLRPFQRMCVHLSYQFLSGPGCQLFFSLFRQCCLVRPYHWKWGRSSMLLFQTGEKEKLFLFLYCLLGPPDQKCTVVTCGYLVLISFRTGSMCVQIAAASCLFDSESVQNPAFPPLM